MAMQCWVGAGSPREAPKGRVQPTGCRGGGQSPALPCLVTLEGGASLDLPVRTPPHHHLLPGSLPVTLASPVPASRAAGVPGWTWCTPFGLEEELPVGAAGRAGTLRGRELVIVEQLQGGAGVW